MDLNELDTKEPLNEDEEDPLWSSVNVEELKSEVPNQLKKLSDNEK
jgi:hypothetical protein